MPAIVFILLAVIGCTGMLLGVAMNRPDPPRQRPSISKPVRPKDGSAPKRPPIATRTRHVTPHSREVAREPT